MKRGGGNPIPVIYLMFKQLITSTLLATSIGIQNTSTTTASGVNQQNSYNAIDTENIYTNETLDESTTIGVLDYKEVWIGSNINVKVRAIQKASRQIAEETYIFNQLLVMKLDSTITTTNWQTSLYNNPQYNTLLQSTIYVYGYYQNPSQTILDFINGTSYTNNYGSLNNLYNTINTYTTSGTMDITNNYITYNNNNHLGNYIVIRTTYNYDPTKITDNGAFMYGLQPYTDITQTLTWEIPSSYTYEVVDIPGMMFSILGMPFAWLSTAFNFTIFPGTPYAINISQILMAIVIGLIAIYIAKKLIK